MSKKVFPVAPNEDKGTPAIDNVEEAIPLTVTYLKNAVLYNNSPAL